jgi:CubicO group peptidase (beta-lactamase class C family)
MRTAVAVVIISLLGVTYGAGGLPVPRFTDPARRSKLESALPEIDQIFERFWKERGAPGLAFGIIIDGDLVHAKGFGVRDRDSNDPVTPDTVFRIASMTKSFTALAVLKLRDEGKLSLDDLAAKWIPELESVQLPTRDSAPIRVRQLLTHGVGLPEDNPWGDRQLAVPDATLDRWLRQGLPFSTPPDTAYEYSNYGLALAGRVVAKASGMPYREYVEKNILAPLGMKASTLEPSAVPEKVRAAGYGKTGDTYTVIPSLAHGSFGAMGGMLVSTRDLARYVAFHLSAWPPRDEQENGPVRRSSVREMQRVWRTSNFQVNRNTPDGPLRAMSGGYGYGVAVSRDCRFAHIVGHGGGLPGFGSYMWWLPEYGVGMIAMTNLTYTAPTPAIDEAFDVLRRTGGLKPRELPASPVLISTRDAISKLWQHWDNSAAEALAADNLFLDSPAATRSSEIEKIKKEVGACREPGELEPENLLRGKFRLPCERGFVDVSFTLAPTMPPKVQFLRFSGSVPLDVKTEAAARGIASLIGSWSDEQFRSVADPKLDAAALRRQAAVLQTYYGSCRLGETLSNDGKTQATVRLECERGPLNLRLGMGEGKIREASFQKPANVACSP